MRRAAWAIAVTVLTACPGSSVLPRMCPANCLGCCNENGICESGLLAPACGFNGSACVACDDGVQCLRGTCAPVHDGGVFPCGQSGERCDGQFADLCIQDACSCGGAAPCLSGANCIAGRCVCTATCDGCCTGGACIDGGDILSCGSSGAACMDCTDAGADGCANGACSCGGGPACPAGLACVGGQCQCDSSQCLDGCCLDGGACQHPADQSFGSCGAQGNLCVRCTSDTADGCIDGFCRCGLNGACAVGQQCLNGQCVCNAASCDGGCCVGNACLNAQSESTAQCGPIGGTCIACPASTACLATGCDCVGRLPCGATSIAAGVQHSCAVTVSGDLRCWGANVDGGADLSAPSTVFSGTTVRAAVTGFGFTCAATDTSTRCFGATPTPVITTPVFDPASLSAGAHHVCGLSSGDAFCWGENLQGQVGPNGDAGVVVTPAPVSGLDGGVAQIAAGASHTCALVAGHVLCWGQFDTVSSTAFDSPVPVEVPVFLDGGVTAIASGDGVSCASRAAEVICWGKASPAVGTFTLVATALSVGSGFACAVVPGSHVACWGSNAHGELGTPDAGGASPTLVPLGGVTAVSCGTSHACALGANLQVRCWGDGAHDELGNGNTADQPAPVPVSD